MLKTEKRRMKWLNVQFSQTGGLTQEKTCTRFFEGIRYFFFEIITGYTF